MELYIKKRNIFVPLHQNIKKTKEELRKKGCFSSNLNISGCF